MKRPSMNLIVGLGSAALAAAVALPRQGGLNFPKAIIKCIIIIIIYTLFGPEFQLGELSQTSK